MATYKKFSFLKSSQDAIFDTDKPPGDLAPESGICRCTVCGNEDACNKGKSLPPENHHTHKPGLGKIRWQLIVRTA